MLRPLDLRLTKAAIDLSDQYSLRSQRSTIQQPTSRSFTDRNQSMIDLRNEKQWPRFTILQQRTAALLLRNTLRDHLRKDFKRMLMRVVIKKTAYKLLTSKRKRDVEAAFLAIKGMIVKQNLTQQWKFREKHTEMRVLACIYKKIQLKHTRAAFNYLKGIKQRDRRMDMLAKMIYASTERAVARIYYSEFMSKIRLIQIRHMQRDHHVGDILRIDQLRLKNVTTLSFNHLRDAVLYEDCDVHLEKKKSKHAEINVLTTSRKQTLTQLREQLKALKINIEQEKLARNKVFQERKKFNTSNKIVQAEAVRKYEKEKKVEDSITGIIESQYNQQQRRIQFRDDLRQKSLNSQNRCYQIYKILQYEEGNVIKNLCKIFPNLIDEIVVFKQSPFYLFKMNLLIQRLIDAYEKRQAYNYEAEYYQLDYENNVIKETIRCFVNQKYQSFVYDRLVSSKGPADSQESQPDTEAFE